MKWLLEFFCCENWKEFAVVMVLASVAMLIFWFTLALVFALFG
jgi:hypothetical protein